MKRTKTLLAFLAVLTMTTAAQAQTSYDFQAVTPQGDTLLCTIVDSAAHHVSVRGDAWSYNTHYIHYNADLVLPDSVEHGGVRYAVTEVSEEAFQSHLEIETITVPDGITIIGNKAFSLVPNVIYHGIATGSPWGANTVNGYEEDSLFYSDNSKTHLTASRHITSAVVPVTVRVIGTRAFYYKSSLTSVTLPEGLDTIGNQAFGVCDGLEGITIPSTVKHIGKSAFYSAFRPTATVTIDDAAATIGNGAFYYSNMKKIELGNRVTFIDNGAFNSCTHLDSIIVPNSVQYIGRMAFCYNYSGSIKKIRLPEGIDTIRYQTFFGCTGLEEVNIPSSVVYIDTAAFHECWELTKLTLPAGLTHIGEAAFFQCRNIDTLVSLAPEPPVAFANTFTQMNSNLTLIVPCHSDSLYAAAPYWSQFHNIQADCGAGIDGIEENGLNIYTLGGRIIVEGAEGETVRIYDITGRSVHNEALHTGVYIVKVGDRPARKIVVMK
ncbi:MAG: leucine-rich repeat domain-containing protein [Bacteroidaceae bacterium]|nr:leucine-rich repeat domain-containing protein [Bacteroidaceae bacterium]